jgi:hypothetical protein
METMIATPEVTAAPTSPAILKIDDPGGLELCDRCPQSALWRVVYEPGELLFCGHHARAYGFAGGDSHSAYQHPGLPAKTEIKKRKGK